MLDYIVIHPYLPILQTGKIMVEALEAFPNALVWKNGSNLEFQIQLSDYCFLYLCIQECKFTAIVLTLTLFLTNQLQSLNRRMLIESLSQDCLLFPHSSEKVLAQFHYISQRICASHCAHKLSHTCCICTAKRMRRQHGPARAS